MPKYIRNKTKKLKIIIKFLSSQQETQILSYSSLLHLLRNLFFFCFTLFFKNLTFFFFLIYELNIFSFTKTIIRFFF